MKRRTIILFVMFFLFSISMTAQDTLILMNGKKLPVKSSAVKDYEVAYRTLDTNAKLKRMSTERVFSIVHADGTEQVIFRTDSLDPLDFSTLEMRNFIRGMQDARQFYRNRPVVAGGFVFGAISAVGGFYGVLGPPLYATIMGSFSPKVSKKLTFKVGGPAGQTAGIEAKKYLNNVTGSVSSPLFGSGQQLKINSHSLTLTGNVDSAVAEINNKFKCHLVHAKNNNGQLTIYRSDDPALLAQNAYREGFEKRSRDFKIRRSALAGLIGLLTSSIAISIISNN